MRRQRHAGHRAEARPALLVGRDAEIDDEAAGGHGCKLPLNEGQLGRFEHLLGRDLLARASRLSLASCFCPSGHNPYTLSGNSIKISFENNHIASTTLGAW